MTNSQVAQAFADRKTTGHSNNMFINRDTIFSYGYHFPIARHTDKMYQNKPIVLFTTRKYSMTTSHHKANVWSALTNAGYYLLHVDCMDMDVLGWIKEKSENIQKAEDKAKRSLSAEMRSYWLEVKSNEILQLAAINYQFLS